VSITNREGVRVAWGQAPKGDKIPIHCNTKGEFIAYIEVSKTEEDVAIRAASLKAVQQKLKAYFAQSVPTANIKGTLVDVESGKFLAASFVGIHAGTGDPRFKGLDGKIVDIDRWAGGSSWRYSDTIFVPANKDSKQKLDELVEASQKVVKIEETLRVAREVRDMCGQECGIKTSEITSRGRTHRDEIPAKVQRAIKRIEAVGR
jgi:hypothetical protein